MGLTHFDVYSNVGFTTSAPNIPLYIGTQWQPGDKRFIWVECAPGLTFSQFAGWQKVHDQLISGSRRVGIFTRVLAAGDGDGQLQFSTVGGWGYVGFTARGWDASQTLAPASGGSSSNSASTVAPSVATGLGRLFTFHTVSAPDNPSGAFCYSTPAGMTPEIYRADRWVAASAGRVTLAMFSENRTTGTSGTRTAIQSPNGNGTAIYPGPWGATSLFIRTLPTTTINLGKAIETDTARAVALTYGPVTIELGKAIETDTAREIRNPLMTVWEAPPVYLKPGIPLGGSSVAFDINTPGTTSAQIQSSVDNGASYQDCVDGSSVPRLAVGKMVAQVVLFRAVLRRHAAGDTPPQLRRLETRITLDATREEVFPLGVFNINDSEMQDSLDGLTLEISGADRSRKVSRNRWETTYVLYQGTNAGTAVRSIIADRLPGTQFNFASTEEIVGTLFLGEDSSNDPLQDAQDVTLGAGMELYWDRYGVCTWRPEPDPDIDMPVWKFEDKVWPTILSATRRLSDANTYNRIVVLAEGSAVDVPVRGTAEDEDPASPTYVLGRFGRSTLIIRSDTALTGPQCYKAAQAALLRQKGATEEVELQVVPVYKLEQGDIIVAERELSKLSGAFIIDSMHLPFSHLTSMRVTSRRQRLT